MKRRSNIRRCLLCLANCFSTFEDRRGQEYYGAFTKRPGRLEMAGAGKCNQLQLQLEKVFILRKILDIPESWCEDVLLLQNNCNVEETDNERAAARNPANWFAVCDQCMDTSVAEIWRIYQQIMALEVQMKEIKEKAKGRMLEEIIRPRNRSWTFCQQQRAQLNDGGGVEGKIINFVFPELTLINVESGESDGDCNADNEAVEMASEFEMDDIISNYGDDFFGQDQDDMERKVENLLPPRRSKNRKSPKKKMSSGETKKRVRVRHRQSRSTGVWYSCIDSQCRARYRNCKDLEAHTRAHEERNQNGGEKTELDCPKCTFPARDMIELELHIDTRHRFQNRPYYFPCPQCDFRVQDDFFVLKAHFDQEHPSDEDPLQSNLVLSSEQPLACPHCSRRCESLRSFLIHSKSCHPEQMGMQVETLECDQCGLKFSTRHALQAHVSSKHTQPKMKLDSKFVCEECGEGFQYKGRLVRHKIKHQREKRDFVCHHCGLDYAYKWLLDDHCRKFHQAIEDPTKDSKAGVVEKEYKCKYCDFSCTIKGIWFRHLKQHKQERGFKCNKCGNTYVNETGLKRHIKIIHPPTNESFPCPHCSKPFKSHEYMRQHVRTNCKIKKLQSQDQSSLSVVEESVPVLLAVGSIKFDSSCNVNRNEDDVIISAPERVFLLPSNDESVQ